MRKINHLQITFDAQDMPPLDIVTEVKRLPILVAEHWARS